MISVVTALALKEIEKLLINASPVIEEFLMSEIEKAGGKLLEFVQKKTSSKTQGAPQ